tara:strand:+ start:473 stop:940 length:468 start_codon:yes stop_codon:yes gene_type:complete
MFSNIIIEIKKMFNLSLIILKYFYLGDFKYAPGTIASFFIAVIWFFIPNIFFVQLLILVFHIFFGFYFCYKFISNTNETDPGYIVIDEVVGMMIALFLIPKSIPIYVASFILFRFLDILKPSFIHRSQDYGYGLGIMLDDIIAGIIVLIVIQGYC